MPVHLKDRGVKFSHYLINQQNIKTESQVGSHDVTKI
jgi:hypothetical protein